MAVKRSQEKSIDERAAMLQAARALTDPADVYREGEDAGLTAQQWQAVRLLVSGKKQVDIAQAIGVTQETVSRWRSQPVFVAALNLALQDAYAASIGEVRDAARDALTTLRYLVTHSEDERVRLSAALSLVRLHLQLDAGVLQLPQTPAGVEQEWRREALINAF